MARTSFRNRAIVPLLFLLLVGGTAAAPSAESLYRDARAAFARGDVKAAGNIASGALQRFGNSDDPWVWSLRVVQADVLLNEGKYPAARKLLQRPFPARLVGSEVEVLVVQGLALAAYRLEDPAVESLITRAVDLARKRHPRKLPTLLVYRATFDEKNRQKWAREALRLAQQYKDIDAELRARGTIALDLANHERFDEAIGMWEAALPQARKTGNESLVQKFEGNVGWSYLELGDYESADTFFTRALATATRLGVRYDTVPWTYQLGNVRLKQDDLEGAEKQYRAAYELAIETKHRQKPIVLSYLANYELQMGRLTDAQRYCDESLRERRSFKDTEGELRSLLIAGRIASTGGRFDEGRRRFQDVIDRTTSNSTKSEAHGRLAQLYVKQGNFVAAEEYFVRATAMARDARKNIGDQELRFSFFNAVEELYDSYVDFLMARGRKAEALEITESSRAQTLEESLTDLDEVRDVRDVARKSNATILCYWLGNTRSYLWIITGQKITWAALPPRRTIEAELDRYQNDLLGQRGTLAGSGSRGRALWRMLVEPASRSIPPGSRVIIVPHGRLNAFNFETLVAPTPTQHYWIDDAILTTASSVRLLMRKQSVHNASKHLLLVGDAPSPGKDFAPLPHARAELNKVARHFTGRYVMLSGAKATPAAYRSASPENFAFLHFVAHGVAMRLKPLDSAVVLASDGEAFKLYARDIAKHPLTAKLVTISSCHGAGTRTYAGEGLIGLGWAFLHAGADNVVAALWEVDDRATPDLMNDFYGSLARGNDPPAALRNAKLALKARGGTYSAPRYWAPFLLYGSS